ncbi:MAG: hypothetical protein ACK2UO_13280, partial [Caldilineaceae bacterium]
RLAADMPDRAADRLLSAINGPKGVDMGAHVVATTAHLPDRSRDPESPSRSLAPRRLRVTDLL